MTELRKRMIECLQLKGPLTTHAWTCETGDRGHRAVAK